MISMAVASVMLPFLPLRGPSSRAPFPRAAPCAWIHWPPSATSDTRRADARAVAR